LQLPEDPVAQAGGNGDERDRTEQGGGTGQEASPLPAGGASVGVAGDPLADEGREPAVPVLEDAGQVGTVPAAVAGHQQGTQRPLDLVAQAAEEDVGVADLDAHGVGQVLALQPVAQVQVEDGPVPRGQAGCGRPDEGHRLLLPGGGVDLGLVA
jgi:hypothetical protein